jgi:hypothetical protein
MDHADRIIERLLIDDQARMARIREHLHELAQPDVLAHRDDIGARHHDVDDAALAQPEDVLEEDAFLGREPAPGCARLQQIGQVGADRSPLPAEDRPQRPGEPIVTLPVRRRLRHRHRKVAHFARRPRWLGRERGIMLRHGDQQSGSTSRFA